MKAVCCIWAVLLGGCAHFHDGPSEALPAAERLVIEGRGQLRVIDRGQGEDALLLVHGYGSSSASYARIVDRLAERHRVLVVDLPGFGRSDKRAGDYSPGALADVLARILDQKGIERAHVMGHSWGASVVLAFALRHPDRLNRLIVASGWMYDDQLLPMFRWARARGVGEGLYSTFYTQNIGERLYLNFHDPSFVDQRTVEEVEKNMRRPGAVAAALAAARGMRYAEVEDKYRTITAPALLIWGRQDRVSRPIFGERLAAELPDARLVLIGQCGHIPMIECPGETATAILDFLGAARP